MSDLTYIADAMHDYLRAKDAAPVPTTTCATPAASATSARRPAPPSPCTPAAAPRADFKRLAAGDALDD